MSIDDSLEMSQEIPPSVILNKQAPGINNKDAIASADRLEKAKTYRDLSTICIIPTRGMIHAKVVQSWWGMITPMNQKFTRVMAVGMEVGAAYNWGIQKILAHPVLSTWKYILTLEEDNLPPPDGLMKLYESIDDYDVVGGLYWTKGEGGQPMIYGDPKSDPLDFIPQKPRTGEVQQANGLGMGFNLFKLDIFKDSKVPNPWFKTLEEYDLRKGTALMTQDLYFYKNIAELGYKVACDNRVKVGHYDAQADVVW